MKNLLFIFSLLFLCSCGKGKNEQYASLLQKWSGKEILFPRNLTFTIQGKDTVDFPLHTKYRILNYVDSTGCMGCKLHLDDWKMFIKELGREDSIQYLFFLAPHKRSDIISRFKSAGFNYPICIDETDMIGKINQFPKISALQTFLLDENNKVLIVGNPILNHKVKELYLNIISGKTPSASDGDRKQQPTTSVSLSSTEEDLGQFPWKMKATCEFTLTNRGKVPLVIHDVNTSCGCTFETDENHGRVG